MKKRYRVELDVTVDGVDESKLLQIAREYYRKTGGAGETAGEDARCPRKSLLSNSCPMPGKPSRN
jgi:hypothetical protein